jgi:hypothetical protein
MDIPLELIAAKDAIELSLLALPGVVGIGLGMREENGELFDELAVRILVDDGVAAPDGLPEELAGFPICIVAGSISPCAADSTRYPMISGGIQIANPSSGTGTLGGVVQDVTTGALLGLSCRHVVGDPGNTFPHTIWQANHPPLIVGASIPADDNVGGVIRSDFPQTPPLPLSAVLVGLVDAAVFTLDGANAQGRAASPLIASEIGQQPALIDKVTATALPTVGQEVRKRGATTRLTGGIVISSFVTCQWAAGPSNTFLIEQAEIAGSSTNPGVIFGSEGDSGAFVLDARSPTAVGLLWGKKHGGRSGVMSVMTNVESRLGVAAAWA